MGEQIVEQLHSNDKLGWRFPETKDEAMNKLNAGKYYAVIVVGDDFSRSLYDFLTMVLIHQQLHIMEFQEKCCCFQDYRYRKKHSSEHYQFRIH